MINCHVFFESFVALLVTSLSCAIYSHRGRHGGLMVSALVSGASGLGSSPALGHCVVFLDKVLYSPNASLHPGV